MKWNYESIKKDKNLNEQGIRAIQLFDGIQENEAPEVKKVLAEELERMGFDSSALPHFHTDFVEQVAGMSKYLVSEESLSKAQKKFISNLLKVVENHNNGLGRQNKLYPDIDLFIRENPKNKQKTDMQLKFHLSSKGVGSLFRFTEETAKDPIARMKFVQDFLDFYVVPVVEKSAKHYAEESELLYKTPLNLKVYREKKDTASVSQAVVVSATFDVKSPFRETQEMQLTLWAMNAIKADTFVQRIFYED